MAKDLIISLPETQNLHRMGTKKGKRYSKEFKLEAVRLAKGADQPVTAIASQNG